MIKPRGGLDRCRKRTDRRPWGQRSTLYSTNLWKLPARVKRQPSPGVAAKISIALALLAGAVLRVWMLRKFFEVNGDSQLYGGMAKNLLLHGQYALTDQAGGLHATLIRLPGYPLFLAACFRLFGMENYYAAACVQILLALVACGLLARFVYRIFPPGHRMAAAQATLWLAALCPFTAIYDAEPLTESLCLFCISLALWSGARFQDRRDWPSALAFTFAVTYSAFLRPDGALVGVALVPALFLSNTHRTIWDLKPAKGSPSSAAEARISHRSLVCLLLALAPFTAWTWRNWRGLPRHPAARSPLRHRSRRRHLAGISALGENLVPRLRFHLPVLLERPRRPDGPGHAAVPGVRLACAVR